jgi:phasin
MARLQAGGVQLGWREWGGGDVTVVFIHGNLASKDWIELAAPLFPSGLRVIGLDWRGCGESDRPKATTDYSNYSMQQHAEDMLAALDSLDIRFCHLATHSTGGIIAARMLWMQPQRFGRVLALDSVTPLGMLFNAEQIGLFRSMMASKELTRAVMATAASSLFVPESLAPNAIPRFREGVGETAALFEQILEQTFGASEGIWIGTPAGEWRFGAPHGGDPSSASGAVGRARRLDSARRSPDNGCGHAGLPARRYARYRAFDESRAAGPLRRVFRCLVRWPFKVVYPRILEKEELAMSDANLSADKVRTMLAETNGRLRKASAEYFDLLEKGLSSSPLPVADQAKQFCGLMQRNITATFELGDKLIQAKDMQEATRIQSEFFQDQMRSLTDHAKTMGESAMKAATSVFTPKN